MNRALGLHFLGERYSYTLIQSFPEEPAKVLAAGDVAFDDIESLHSRLAGSLDLPWCLAAESEGTMMSSLPTRWPLRPLAPEVLMHPATAAALWDWEHGRFDEKDLYLWLRAGTLMWAKGTPGLGRSGCIARRGPLGENLRPVLARVQRSRCSAVICLEGDAPGGDFLMQALEEAGHPPRLLHRPPQEMGADPASAGAALAALTPTFQAVYVPERQPKSSHWRTAMGLGALVAVLAAGAFSKVQESRLGSWIQSTEPKTLEGEVDSQAAAAPPELNRLLERRTQFHQNLRKLSGTPPGSLVEAEILSTPDSPTIRDRVRLR